MKRTVSSNTPSAEGAERAIDFLRRRKQAYLQTFPQNLATEAVLDDLAKFCRAGTSAFDPDPRVHALLEGRREVWTRIAQHLDMSPDQLYAVFVLGAKHMKKEI